MALQSLPLMQHPGVAVFLDYDDVTLAASQVRANNTSPFDCFVSVQNIASPATQRSGILAAGQSAAINVSGAVTLTRAVIAPSTTPVVAVTAWALSSRFPA